MYDEVLSFHGSLREFELFQGNMSELTKCNDFLSLTIYHHTCPAAATSVNSFTRPHKALKPLNKPLRDMHCRTSPEKMPNSLPPAIDVGRLRSYYCSLVGERVDQ